MAVTGWILPTGATIDSGGGSWVNETNILADDGAEATFTLSVKNTSGRWLWGETFGFDSLIPVGSIITQVRIRADWRVNSTGGIANLELQAFVGGAAVGSVRANSSEPTTLTTDTFDITADRAWTRADLLNSTFQLRVRGRNGNNATDPSYRVDHIAVEVTFLSPGEMGWDKQPTRILPGRRTGIVAALLAPALAFVPLVEAGAPTADAAVQGESGLVPRAAQVQYQPVTGPVAVPAVVAETPHDWRPVHPDLLARAVSRIPAAQAFAWAVETPAEAPVVPEQWTPVYPSSLAAAPSVRPHQTFAWHSETPAGGEPPATPEQWYPSYPTQHARPLTPARYDRAQPHFPVIVDVPVMSWTGQFPDLIVRAGRRVPLVEVGPVRYDAEPPPPTPADAGAGADIGMVFPTRQTQYVSLVGPVRVEPSEPVGPPDQWTPIYPARVPGRRPLTWTPPQVAPLYVPDVTAPVPATSWIARFADRVLPKRGLWAALQQTLGWNTDTPVPPPVVFNGDRRGKQARGRARVRGRR